jgi:hypothetical protein
MGKKKESKEIWTNIITKANTRPKRFRNGAEEETGETFAPSKPKKTKKNSPEFEIPEANIPILPPKMKNLAMRLKRKKGKNNMV